MIQFDRKELEVAAASLSPTEATNAALIIWEIERLIFQSGRLDHTTWAVTVYPRGSVRVQVHAGEASGPGSIGVYSREGLVDALESLRRMLKYGVTCTFSSADKDKAEHLADALSPGCTIHTGVVNSMTGEWVAFFLPTAGGCYPCEPVRGLSEAVLWENIATILRQKVVVRIREIDALYPELERLADALEETR